MSSDTVTGLMVGGHGRSLVSRLAVILIAVVIVLGADAGQALGVVRGKTVSITAAPWTVVVWEAYEPGRSYAACTGVIIDPRQILTAGHCVTQGNSATPMAPSAFRIEAGTSNYEHPLASDHPQFSAVSAVRVMPGYIADTNSNPFSFNLNGPDPVATDLAVLTLSKPFELSGADAKAASVPSTTTPEPTPATWVVMAGFGDENANANAPSSGALHEVPKSTAEKTGCQQVCILTRTSPCSTRRDLCVFDSAGTCWGDSGSGLVEPGPHPIVVGILSRGWLGCRPGWDNYVAVTAPEALRFIVAVGQRSAVFACVVVTW
jgi:secreted trypsin-like serine protease